MFEKCIDLSIINVWIYLIVLFKKFIINLICSKHSLINNKYININYSLFASAQKYDHSYLKHLIKFKIHWKGTMKISYQTTEKKVKTFPILKNK